MTRGKGGSPGPRSRPGPRPDAPPDRLRLRYELGRKAIHLATVVLPVAVWFLPRPVSVVLLVSGAAVALAVEWARTRVRWARHLFLTRTRRLLRPHERRGLAGATWMALAYLLAFILFPLPIAVAAMLYNALGDAAAAVIGKRWGRHRLAGGKSWEGAAAGFGVDLAIGLAVPGIGAIPAAVGALAAALLELAPIRVDDNLRVTLGGGAALWAAVALA